MNDLNTPKDIELCAIVAMAENRVIGGDNKLLWHIPADLKHFKRTTMGCPLIMGRKTFQSLPGVLPGRPHIVISRSGAPDTAQSDMVHYKRSIEDAIAHGTDIANQTDVNRVFITGGGEIYRQTLPHVHRLHLTIVHKAYEGDTVFPEINWNEWDVTQKDEFEAEQTDKGMRPAFTIYEMAQKQLTYNK